MVFVNEYISTEDFEKYHFSELNKRPKTMGTSPARDWTINRETETWLRLFCVEFDHTVPDGGYTGLVYWDFFWGGSLIEVKIKNLESGGSRGGHCWARKELVYIGMPDELEYRKSDVIDDLELALNAYREGGVRSSSTSFTLTFLF